MSAFANFMKDKPACFSIRRDLLVNPSVCGSCVAQRDCLSMQLDIMNAVSYKNIPNSYSKPERIEFRQRHSNICHAHGIYEFKEFEPDIVAMCHDRFYPPRSQDDIELAYEYESMIIDESPTICPAIEAPIASLGKTIAQPLSQPKIAALTPKSIAFPSSIGAPKYFFPLPTTSEYSSLTNRALADVLMQLMLTAFKANPVQNYLAIRESFCAIHIEMNHRQSHAPRFRSLRRLAKAPTSDADRFEALDRQVIDLHWRALSFSKPNAIINNYPTLFDAHPFDLNASEKFAQENWRPRAKVVHMHLTDEMQWEHGIIQAEAIRKRWADIDRGRNCGDQVLTKGAPHIERQLRDAVNQINKPQLVRNIPGMVAAWKARQIVGEGSAKIARMVAIMEGEKIRDSSAMRKTLKSLDYLLSK